MPGKIGSLPSSDLPSPPNAHAAALNNAHLPALSTPKLEPLRCQACQAKLDPSVPRITLALARDTFAQDFEESFVHVPGYTYPAVLTKDCPAPELDCISLAVAEDNIGSSASDPSNEQSSPLKIFELLLTFVAVVCLWGSIDDIVEVIARGNSKWGILVYLSFASTAILLQMLCNKIFRTDMSIARGMDMF